MNIRKTEEALMEALKSITILDKDGKEHKVPVIYGTAEHAAAYMKGDSVLPLKPDCIRLPLIAFKCDSVSRKSMGFTGLIYTLYRQDLNQIIEKLFDLEESDCSPIETRRPFIGVGTVSIHESDSVSGGPKVIIGRFGCAVT